LPNSRQRGGNNKGGGQATGGKKSDKVAVSKMKAPKPAPLPDFRKEKKQTENGRSKKTGEESGEKAIKPLHSNPIIVGALPSPFKESGGLGIRSCSFRRQRDKTPTVSSGRRQAKVMGVRALNEEKPSFSNGKVECSAKKNTLIAQTKKTESLGPAKEKKGVMGMCNTTNKLHAQPTKKEQKKVLGEDPEETACAKCNGVQINKKEEGKKETIDGQNLGRGGEKNVP